MRCCVVTRRWKRGRAEYLMTHSLCFLLTSISGVACFAIYRFKPNAPCHLNLWKWIDQQGVRTEHLRNRFFTVASNGEISIIDHSRLATDLHLSALVLPSVVSCLRFWVPRTSWGGVKIRFLAHQKCFILFSTPPALPLDSPNFNWIWPLTIPYS